MSIILTRKGSRKAPRWIPYAIVAGAILFLLPFYYFRQMDLAQPSLFGVVAISCAAATFWKWRIHQWFWAAIAIVVALHIYAILRIAWGHRELSEIEVLAYGLADYLGVLAFIKLVEIICRKTEESPNR